MQTVNSLRDGFPGSPCSCHRHGRPLNWTVLPHGLEPAAAEAEVQDGSFNSVIFVNYFEIIQDLPELRRNVKHKEMLSLSKESMT